MWHGTVHTLFLLLQSNQCLTTRATVYQPEGLGAPMEPIPLRRIKLTKAAAWGRRRGGRTGASAPCLGINQYIACSDKSSWLQWPTGPHTLTHKTILVLDVKTANSYHCHGSAARWCVIWKSAQSQADAGSTSLAPEAWTVCTIYFKLASGSTVDTR